MADSGCDVVAAIRRVLEIDVARGRGERRQR
jgi:hypothetical protein